MQRRRRHPSLDLSSTIAGVALGLAADSLLLLAAIAAGQFHVPLCDLCAWLALGALTMAGAAGALARRARLETALSPERFQPPCARAARSVARLCDGVAATALVLLWLAVAAGLFR